MTAIQLAAGRLVGRLVRPSASRSALIGTIIGSAAGFILPFAITDRFHAGRASDTYFFTYALAVAVVSLLSGAIEANTLPVARILSEAGRRRFSRFLALTAAQAVVIGAAVYLVCALGGIFFLADAAHWQPSQEHSSRVLFLIFGAFAVAVSATSVLDAGLYALGEFLLPTSSVALRGVLSLAAASIVSPSYGGMYVIAVSLAVGECLRGVWLVTRLRKKVRRLNGESAPRTRSVWSTASAHALSLALNTTAPMVDRAFATSLTVGSVTVVDLGERILWVPVTVITSSVVLVAGARWAGHMVDKREILSQEFWSSSKRGMAIAIGLTLVCVAGVSLLPLVFGREAFGAPSSKLTVCALLLLLGVPAATFITFSARLLTVLRRTRILPLMALMTITNNFVFDFLGVKVAGIYGIVGGSTICRTLSAIVYFVLASRELRRHNAAQGDTNGASQVPTPSDSHADFEPSARADITGGPPD